mgnify:CR=1 FL=1
MDEEEEAEVAADDDAAVDESPAPDVAESGGGVAVASGPNTLSPESCRSIMTLPPPALVLIEFFVDRCAAAAMCISFVFSLMRSMSF